MRAIAIENNVNSKGVSMKKVYLIMTIIFVIFSVINFSGGQAFGGIMGIIASLCWGKLLNNELKK